MAGGTRLASKLLLSVFLFVRAQDDIREPPKMLELQSVKWFYDGGVYVTLQCRASGQPTPLYEWYCNGAPIESTNQAISYDPSNGSLTIKGLTTREEGFYNCRAMNTFPNGMSAVAISDTIEVRRTRIEPWDKDQDRTKTATEGNYVSITCGDTLPKYYGPITFQWYTVAGEDDLIEVAEDKRIFIDNKGTLHFTYVLRTDEQSNRYYSCAMSNVVERQITLGGRTRLVVQKSDSIAEVKPALQFSTKLAGDGALTFERNTRGYLECFFSGYVNDPGNEVPTIEWQDNAGNTIVGGTGRYTIESHGRVLKIALLEEKYEKPYTCIARNRIGTAEGRMVLNVISSPIWVKPLQSTTVPQGKDAVFHCEARSAAGEDPPDPPRWFKNGQRLDMTYDPNKFAFANEKRELRVKSAQKNSDIACFQCYVGNSVGEEFSDGCLNVILPIELVAKPVPEQTIERGDIVNLTVVATADKLYPIAYKWHFKNTTYEGVSAPPHVIYNVNTNLAYINTSNLAEMREIRGVYSRQVYHEFETVFVNVKVKLKDEPVAELVESEKTGALRKLSMAKMNNKTLPKIANTTKAVLRQNTTTSALDVILVANILEKATGQRHIPIETATDILEIVELVSGLNMAVLQQSNTEDKATNRVLQAVESLGDSVSLGDSGTARIQTNNTVIQVWNLITVSDSHVLGLELALDSGEVTEIREGQGWGNRSEGKLQHDNTDTAIMLPGKTFRSIVQKYPGQHIRISSSISSKTSLFRSSAPTVTDADSCHRHATLNSKVSALRITVDGQPKTDLSAYGKGSVTTVFTPIQSLSKEQSLQRELSRCVFWDAALQDGKGAWSEEGCYHSDTVEGKVVCECDHLTNFAVLMDLYGQESCHDSILSLISVVGLSLSIAGLSVTVISFIVIKKLHSSHPQQTLFNMALAMLLAWVTFLAGFSRVHGHVTCVLVAALLHYLILVSFMWMVIEGILQYLLLVKVMVGVFSRYMLKTALPAWGLPLIPVIIILSIDVNLYSGGEQYCWMSRMPFYYAFLAPIIIMVSANIVLYVLVIVSICRRRDMSHGGTSYNVVSIRASIGCFVVLGLSWVFAFFAIEDARLVFQYLFTCTTAFQGFLIFAIFTARDPAVRQFWMDLICRCKQVRRGSPKPLPVMQPFLDRPGTKETSFNRTK